MAEHQGHIELERSVHSIIIGIRQRHDLGDLQPLMESISQRGLLQPVTVTPDGVLVCGRRRLEAVKQLGWRTLRVWVRSGISDVLSQLLAQQDENELHKPLTPEEVADLYTELKKLMSEDAARRQEASRFGSSGHSGRENGGVDSTPPGTPGKTREEASKVLTGHASWQRLDRVAEIKNVAQDTGRSPVIRELAAEELRRVNNGADVAPAYERLRAAIELAGDSRGLGATGPTDAASLSEEAKARVGQKTARGGGRTASTNSPLRRSLRAFVLTWSDLDGWSRFYNPNDIAAQLKGDDWEMFERVLAETITFAEEVRALRARVRATSVLTAL